MVAVKPNTQDYHTVTPYLTVRDAPGVLAFVERVFGGRVTERHEAPGGRVMHAEVRLGDSVVMLSEACDEMGPMPGGLYVYVDDVDATYRKALELGATSVMEPADMFWGDRFASIKDASGNVWSLAKRVEEVSREEVARRAKQFAQQMTEAK